MNLRLCLRCPGGNERPDLPGVAFTFQELAAATNNFDQTQCIGEGGFGKVYSGYIKKLNQMVAIKRRDVRNGTQGRKQFETELSVLRQADHPNVVKLIGHCVQGPERLIVYEYHPLGSLEQHLFDDCRPAIDWNTRLKIALGAAAGLDYLHNRMNQRFIYRDMKPSNILLGSGYVPKLSDFGAAKQGPPVETGYVNSSSRLGTDGYCAPEYLATGRLTYKADVYSFGVVLLEIFTGKSNAIVLRAGDLITWARSLLSTGKHFYLMVDHRLKDDYPEEVMTRVLELATRCVNRDPRHRPSASSLHSALRDIASHPDSFRNMIRNSQSEPLMMFRSSKNMPQSSHTPDPRRNSVYPILFCIEWIVMLTIHSIFLGFG